MASERAARLWGLCGLTFVVLSGVVWAAPEVGVEQAPTFRATTSVVPVDVHVIDSAGYPVTGLGASDFQVSIAGKRRRVLSVDLIRHDTADVMDVAPVGRVTESGTLESRLQRDVVVAVDSGSFEMSAWQRTVPALQAFVAALGPDDRVGLIAFPFGPVVPPTNSHVTVSRALAQLPSRGAAPPTRFNLRPSEVVDIIAESAALNSPGTASLRTRRESFDENVDARTVRRVQMRECPLDADCAGRILFEAANAVQDLESRAIQSLAGLESMLNVVAGWPGRKTVVLVSGGVLVSDRPGGRPDAGNLARTLGMSVSRSNAAVFTLHIDSGIQGTYSAAGRSIQAPGFDQTRETEMQSRWLDQFSHAAGGALYRVQSDQGEAALARVRRETSAIYLLGVAPETADGDGRERELKVEVRQRGVVVRSRRWVSVTEAR